MLNLSKNPRSIAIIAVVAFAAMFVAAGCGKKKQSEVAVTKSATRTETPATDVAQSAPAPVTPAVAPAPEPPRPVTYKEAEAAYTAKDYAQAVDLFTRYTQEKPDNPWGHYMLGLSAWKAGQLDTAETELKQTLALDPTHLKSAINLTRVLLDAGRPGEASTTIQTALVIDSTSSDAWRLRGRVDHDLGHLDEAVAAYQRAIRLNPEDAWAMNNLGYLFIEQERFDDALPPLARAVELRTDVATFYNNLGMALERTGHLQDAENAYASAVAADSSNEKADANGARLAEVNKDPGIAPVDLAALARGFVESIDAGAASSVASLGTGAAPVATPAVATTPAPVDTATSGSGQ